MNVKANPTLIGVFIVSAIALGVIGLMTFTSDRFFTQQEKLILYFDASMKGLHEGAPVKWRGVTIGSVAEVLIRHNQASNDFVNPVIIQINPEILRRKSDEVMNLDDPTFLKRRIEKG
ncbi:MAG: MCE family protein, partial [Verrucomicrobiae bacterium]|nr:MCE family protein [Verrucomicrobiae bacterium]